MKLGLYTVLGEIGRGGMGVVYRAQDPSGRAVAVKLLQARREALARFSREARLQDQLGETEGFVPLLDMGLAPQGPYLVMPLLDNGTLRDRLESQGPYPIADAVALVGQLAAGLGKAHARGIVHRDVKPDNVLFSPHGRPLLADLGLAKHFRHDVEGASQSFALSRPGQARGTFGYMAPEQLQDAASSGPPADVYALGAVLYEVVTGQPAFQASTFVELMTKVVEGKVKHPRSLRRDCPPWLSAVIAKALAVDPAKRFPDGAALAAALEAGPRGPSRPLKLLAGVAALAALAVGVAAYTLLTRPSPTPGTTPGEAGAPVEPAWTRLPEPYQALGRVEHGPRLVAVWGDGRDVGPVLALAEHQGGALALEGRGLRQWGSPAPGGLLLATPKPEQRFHAAALRPDLGRALTSSDSLLGWNLEEASPLVEIPLEKPSPAVALSPNGLRGVVALGGSLFRFRLGLGIPAEPTQLPLQHPTPIVAVAASAGDTYLSASRDLIVLHSPRGSQEIPHPSEVVALAFLPPGPRPLSLDPDGTLRVWEDGGLATLAPAPEPDDRATLGPAVALALDAEGARIAVGHLNGVRLLVASPEGWRERGRALLPAGGARLTAVALEGHGASLQVGTSRGAVLQFALEGATPPPAELRWSPLASAGPRRGRLGDNVEAVCGLPSGEPLSVGSDGWVCVWDPADGRLLRSFQAGAPLQGAKLRGDHELITLGGGRCLRVWDLNYDPPAEVQRIGIEALPIDLALTPDGRLAAVADLRGRITYLDLERRVRVATSDEGTELSTLACLADGRLALGSRGKVVVFDPLSGEREEPKLVGGGQVTCIAPISPTRFLAGTDQGAILMHDLTRKTAAWITMIGGEAVRSLTPAGDRVLVGMRRGKLLCLGLESGDTLWELANVAGPQVVASPLGEGRAVVGGTSRALTVIDTASGASLWPAFDGHLGDADALSFTGDGLLSVGTDGARSWTFAGGELTPGWHRPMIYNLQAVAARDGSVLSEELLQPFKAREPLKIGLRLHRPPPAPPLDLDVGEFERIGLSPDGSLGFTFGSDPPRAMVLDLRRDGQMNVIYTLGGPYGASAFSPDGAEVAYALGSKLSLREASKGELRYRVEGRADALAFLPGSDGRLRLLCGHVLGGLELRELEGGKLERSFASEHQVAQLCAVGPDRFVSLDAKRRVFAWDLAQGDEPVAELDLGDPTDHASYLATDPATQRVAVGTGKGRVVLFAWGG
ncbi:MAG: protein kinase [Planctomycetes bacterium]|nr:protein kinase [Planctomycetota bacterium]